MINVSTAGSGRGARTCDQRVAEVLSEEGTTADD